MEIGSLVAAFMTGVFLATLFGVAGCSAAWRNGVVDGFGAAVEPTNPGYKKARKHLLLTSYERWGYILYAAPSSYSFKDYLELVKNTGDLIRGKSQDDHSQAPSPVLWSRADSFTSPGESGAVTGFAPLPGDGGPVE